MIKIPIISPFMGLVWIFVWTVYHSVNSSDEIITELKMRFNRMHTLTAEFYWIVNTCQVNTCQGQYRFTNTKGLQLHGEDDG